MLWWVTGYCGKEMSKTIEKILSHDAATKDDNMLRTSGVVSTTRFCFHPQYRRTRKCIWKIFVFFRDQWPPAAVESRQRESIQTTFKVPFADCCSFPETHVGKMDA